MKRSRLIALKERLAQSSGEPWGCFETTGPDENGRVQFSISWNDAFIDALNRAGYQATTPEETVQIFFMSSRIVPEALVRAGEEETVNPEGTPRLTSEANILKR